MAELKDCPFCNGPARMASFHDEDGIRWHHVVCQRCGARTRGKWHTASNDCPQFYAEVRDEWNLRAADGVATPLSDFIRNASPERKAEVFGRVMDNVTERQQAVIAAAGGVTAVGPARKCLYCERSMIPGSECLSKAQSEGCDMHAAGVEGRKP